MDNNKVDMTSNLNQFKFDPKKSQDRCIQYRKKILDISQQVSALHGGGALSVLEIVDFIYYGLLKEEWNERRKKFNSLLTRTKILSSLK